MTGAFVYLIVTSTRGRIRAQLARLRNPRYALALAVGLFYVWGVYLRPSRQPLAAGSLFGGLLGPLAPLLALLFVAWTWIFGADRAALAFSEAEATMLFTAPVSRRALVLYKIARTQLAILATSVIWTIVFRQGATLSLALTHTIAYWVALSALNLNRLGVALVRSSTGDHGWRAARRHWPAIAIVAAAFAGVAYPLVSARARLIATPAHALGDAIAAALGTTWAALALFPFQLVLAPIGAAPGRAWLEAVVPALLILALLAFWVLQTDAAFEEAATEASARQARRVAELRARRSGAAVAPTIVSRRSLPLAPNGMPAIALVWKNWLWIIRTGQLRGLIAPPAIAFLCIAIFALRSPMWATAIAATALSVAFVLLLFGPMSMRNDLRSELLRLPMVKTLPLAGRDVVLAEVASSAIPVAVTQYLLVLAALVSMGLTQRPPLPFSMRIAVAVTAPLFILGLNGAIFIIHNGLALAFPGWMKLGAAGAGGLETMGMGMLTIFIVMIGFAVLLIAPAITAGVAWALFANRPALAVTVAGTVAGAALVTEAVLLAAALGGALERVEPMQVEG